MNKGQVSRICIGLGLIAFGGWYFIPKMVWVTSNDAVTTAQIGILKAPVRGKILVAPSETGVLVSAGTKIIEIQEEPSQERNNSRQTRRTELRQLNERLLDRIEDAQLRVKHAEVALAAAQASDEAYKNELNDLTILQKQMISEGELFRQANIRRLERMVEEAKKAKQIAGSNLQLRTFEMKAYQRAFDIGIYPELENTSRKYMTQMAEEQVELASLSSERISAVLEAAREGIQLDYGQNQKPYADQRADEISITKSSVITASRSEAARVEEAKQILATEKAALEQLKTRLDKLQSEMTEIEIQEKQATVSVQSNTDGLIWRRKVEVGGPIQPGEELIQILSTQELLVEANFSVRYLSDIKPGDKASVKFLGYEQEVEATVKMILGGPEDREDPSLATKPIARSRDEFLVILTLRPPEFAQPSNAFLLGRRVVVRMKH